MVNYENEYKVANLITKEILGELSEEDSICLNNWRNESDDNLSFYNELYERLSLDLSKEEVDINVEWNSFRNKVNPKRKITPFVWVSSVACSLLIVFCLWTLFQNGQEPDLLVESQSVPERSFKAILILEDGSEYSLLDPDLNVHLPGWIKLDTSGRAVHYDTTLLQSEREIFNTIIIPRGGEFKIVLADGSTVWLNSESKMIYPVFFNSKERNVTIEGEACFDVVRDDNKPFIVKTKDDVQVKVLGTFFNIEAYKDDKEIVTTLLSGLIEVSSKSFSEVIKPNQQISILNDEYVVKEVFAEDYVQWINGIFSFNETRLPEIMEKLARWYDVKVIYENEEIKNARFSFEIKRYDNIVSILERIEKTGRVRFEVKDNKVLIKN